MINLKLPRFLSRKLSLDDFAEKFGGSIFYSASLSTTDIFGQQTKKQNLEDFLQVPEVNAIINYNAWSQSLVKLEALSKTTNKPVANQESVVKVLRQPNYFQTQKELWRQTELFRGIFGNEYLFFLKPLGMPNTLKAIYALPPQHTTIKYPVISDPFFLNVDMPEGIEYEYQWKGRTYPIEAENLLHMNDNNVNQTSENYLEGTSKLNALQPNIQNIRAAYEARNVIIANRGAIGILSNAAKDATGSYLPMNPKEKKDLQEELKKYGLLKKQFRYILTNLSLKWQQITTDLNNLKVFDEVREDFIMICNAFGTPPEIFAQKNITYENKQQAELQYIQNTVIPKAQERIQGVNDMLGTENKSWHLVGTFDHLPIFQEDLKERSEAVNTLVNALNVALQDKAITIEDYKKELKKFNIGDDANKAGQ